VSRNYRFLNAFLLWPEDENRFEIEGREHPMLLSVAALRMTPDPQDFEGPPPIPLNTTVAEILMQDPRTQPTRWSAGSLKRDEPAAQLL